MTYKRCTDDSPQLPAAYGNYGSRRFRGKFEVPQETLINPQGGHAASRAIGEASDGSYCLRILRIMLDPMTKRAV
jgi:hypothetical protein